MRKTTDSPNVPLNKQTPSPQDWEKIWLDKYSRELIKKQLSEKETKFHCTVLRKYLAELPGNPRTIPVDKLKRFVSKSKTDVRPPLILFYKTIALSEAHVEAINSVKLSKARRKRESIAG